MKLQHTFALALAIVLLSNFFVAPAASQAASPGESFSAEVIYVVDGDSILVQKQKNRPAVKIDLAGIEATSGRGARTFLKELAFGKVVDVEVTSTHGGLQARVFLDGKDLGETLVDADFARKNDTALHPIRRGKRIARLTQIVLGGRRGS